MELHPTTSNARDDMDASTTSHQEESFQITRTAAVLLERLKEFRQSYNRTHGQVCEFFEQAHVIERIYQHSPGLMKSSKRERSDEGENEEEGNTEQKTWSIKQKLNSWRAVMREVVSDVCPNLQLENQPDINPGLMKHVLDEIRKLKTELAFQHNTILELTHQLESHQSKNQRKDRLIEKLMHRNGSVDHTGEEDAMHLSLRNGDFFDSIDSDDLLQFGSLNIEGLEQLSNGTATNEHGGTSVVKEANTMHQASSSTIRDICSHSLTNEQCGYLGEIKSDSAMSNPEPSSTEVTSTLDRIPSAHSWKGRRAVMTVCGRLCFVYAACRVMQRRARK